MAESSRRIRVAVVFGGRSSEHAISCISAGSVLSALDRSRYEVVPIGITPGGRWVLASDDPRRLRASGSTLPHVDESGTALVLAGDPTHRDLVVLDPQAAPASLASVDVVFPLLHGPYGEDGTLQGLLELAGVPYVGSGVLASAAAMDKEYMKLLLAARGLPVGEYQTVRSADWDSDRAAVLDGLKTLGFPVFVKPARGGSSIGINQAQDEAALVEAVERARMHDPKVLVEAALTGREIECGVLEGEAGGTAEASLPAEIHVTGPHRFYDFEAKYYDDAGTTFDVPAQLTADETASVRRMAVQAFHALGCEGLARVDFFLTGSGLVINEVNTMPGFTPASMFPRMWAATGMDYPALVDRLLRTALRRSPGLR